MRFFSARLNLDKGILLNFKFFLVNLFQYKTAGGLIFQSQALKIESLGLDFQSGGLFGESLGLAEVIPSVQELEHAAGF